MLTGAGNGIQSSWLRVTSNTSPADAAENTANIKDTWHIFGRHGQGTIDVIPDAAFSYLPSASKEHLVIFSIFPETIDSTGLTGSNEVVIEGNVKPFLTNTWLTAPDQPNWGIAVDDGSLKLVTGAIALSSLVFTLY